MIHQVLLAGAVAALLGCAIAQNGLPPMACSVDAGNGVHVPGAIPANLYEPLQHRLAFAGSDGMTVSWNTFNKLEPEVWYGTSPSKLDKRATSSDSTTYPTSRTYNNHVTIKGLQPGTTYWYKVSYTNSAYAAYRPLYSFKTALPPGDSTPFTIAAFADLGLMGHDGLSSKTGPLNGPTTQLGPNETNTIQSLLQQSDSYDFMIHAGDIGYADYFLKEAIQGYFGVDTWNDTNIPDRDTVAERYESLSEQFVDQVQPITAIKPWLVAAGNHEANCNNVGYSPKKPYASNKIDSTYCLEGQTNFTWYSEHFRMPSAESGGEESFWYSYDYGLAHFVALHTETDLGDGLGGPIQNKTGNMNGPFGDQMNSQIDWLKADLAKVDRSKTPWVIAYLHRPWYVSVNPPAYPAWQQAFEKIFYDNKVDMYMQGHVHVYERFLPTYNGTVDPAGMHNPRAPWPIVNGAAGHYDGLDTFDEPRQNNSAFGLDGVYGWGRLHVHNATHITYEYVSSNSSTVVDSATLYKDRGNKGQGQGHGKDNKAKGKGSS